jgi:serine/threonine-protein kinase
MIGTRLAHYEIMAHLGSGGMGDVYQATDTKLSRSVAIKFLPEAFSHDSERVARFQREARVLASLNHPNIAAIHGVEEIDTRHFLVMELVPGETLADRIKRGTIPIEEALPIAKQIAEALEEAHEKGIIHRDLKPANIKVTPDGKVKVLDFGLAKAYESGPTNVALSNSPTISMAATNAGMILGTAAYMSPEQAKGRPVDRRTDIWAFGCVLYEMLTGRQAFDGDDVTEVLAAVVRGEPDWGRLPEKTPATVHALLRKCLRKDRTLRLQAAGDARIEIQETLSAPAPEPEGAATGARGLRTRSAVLLGAVVLLLGAVFGSVAAWTFKPLPVRAVAHLSVPLPQGERLPPLNTTAFALSPDGSRIAFISARGADQQIYVRAFDSTEAKAVQGTEGADNLVFSPDGKWLAFTARGNLMRVSMAGGAPLTICNARVQSTRGLSWGDTDMIVFADGFGTAGLSKVPAGGGKPQTFTAVGRGSDSSEEAHRWPQVLPGGKAVLFTAWNRDIDDSQIFVQRLDSNERRVVIRGGTYARYVRTGHVVYVRAGTLMAVPFDLSRLEATGEPVPLTEGVLLTSEGAAQFDVSNDGSLVHVPGGLQGSGRQLTWVDRSGKEEPVGAPPRAYIEPRLSPDGRQIAVVVQGTNDDIWTYDIPRRTLTRLTFESRSLDPIWMADGKRIVYRSARNGILNLFSRAADGSGSEERLTTNNTNQTPTAASPDGQALAISSGGPNIWILPLAGDKKPRPFLQTPFRELAGTFSPDSHWLAYNSDESGRNEIYVQPFPGGGGKLQISKDGGMEPRWISSDELFYRNGDKMMVVKMNTKPTLAAGDPQVVFEGSHYVPAALDTFDVSPDGKRFLMIKEPDQAASVTQIDVVLNWIEELKHTVPIH